MNDILEELLHTYYGKVGEEGKLFTFIAKKPDNYPGDQYEYFVNEITYYISKLFHMNDISVSPDFMPVIAEVAELVSNWLHINKN